MLSPDSPASAWILAVALLALLTGLVINAVLKDRREYQRFKRLRTTKRRQAVFRRWLLQSLALFGGSSLVTLLLAWQFIPLLLDEVDRWPWIADARRAFAEGGGLAVGILAGVVAALLGGGILGIVVASRQTNDGEATEIPTVGDVQALLPRNRAELKYGAALSVNAGIVEELLFRLALPAVIYGVCGNAVAAIVGSLLVFALLHVYQGVAGILGSLFIGVILMAVYIATGSIAIAIVLHALFDLRSLVLIPVLVFGVHRHRGNNAPRRVARKPESAEG